MAVKVNLYSVIVPIKSIEKCKNYNTLAKVISRYNQKVVDIITCHDDYLFKDSAMNYADIEDILKFWKEQGLTLKEKRNNEDYWKDLCVVHAINGPTLQCDWLKFVSNKEDAINGPYVYLKSNPKGDIIQSKLQ